MIGSSREVGSIHYSLDLDKKKFDQKHKGVTSQLSALGKKFAVAGAASAALFTAAFGKFVVGGGISRALNIEDAQAKLRGLGHDVKSIEGIMDSALTSVKGTAFGLDEAATISASAVAAGVESGEQLTNYLKLTADASTIAGTSLQEMGSIFNKVQTGQRAYTQELNQLSDRGIPIYQWLQEELGLSAIALREMVARGELDSETYFKVIQKNIGGAALESGKTTRGAWANLQAAMARVGAAIVEDIIPRVRQSFGDMTVWFDKNSGKIVEIISKIVDTMKDFMEASIEAGTAILKYLQPKILKLWQTIQYDLLPALKDLWLNTLEPLATFIGKTLVGALGLLIDTTNIVIKLFIKFKDVALGLAVGFASLKIATALTGIFTAIGASLSLLIAKMNVAILTFQVATGSLGLFKGTLIALKAFLASNPIGLAIIALTALYAGLNHVLNQSTNEMIRQTEAQSKAAEVAAETAANQYQDAIKAYKDLANSASQYINVLNQLTDSEKEVKKLQEELTLVVEKYGVASGEARNKQAELSQAEAILAQHQSDRINMTSLLNEKIISMTYSTGALKNTTEEAINADIKAAEAIRDTMIARGEDTTEIQKLIDKLNSLKDIRKVDIITNADTVTAKTKLEEIRNDLLSIPNSKNINVTATGFSGLSRRLTSLFSEVGYRASGGPVDKNSPYIVGEKGPELFIPSKSGSIVPNSETMQSMSSSMTINGNINIGSQQDADNFFARLSRNQELSSKGLSSMAGSVG